MKYASVAPLDSVAPLFSGVRKKLNTGAQLVVQPFHYTLCLKKVQPLLCYNFDVREHILKIFFGRNITHKVSNQKHFTMPPQITCASALSDKTRKHENRIFSLKCCISVMPEFNQSFLDFFSLFDLRLILTLLYDSLNLTVNAFSSGCSLSVGHGLRERKSRPPQQLDCVACTMHQCSVFLKEKMSSVMCSIASDIS